MTAFDGNVDGWNQGINSGLLAPGPDHTSTVTGLAFFPRRKTELSHYCTDSRRSTLRFANGLRPLKG
jgi:hypothetical protein